MIFAYADPPYPGNAHRYPERMEVDHGTLIQDLMAKYPDGWALSTGSNNLKAVLALCPDGHRVGAWVKRFAAMKPNVRVPFAWEPVIFCGGRRSKRGGRYTFDWVMANATRRKGVVGAKPEAFCYWVFGVLGAQPGDKLDDLFPGTGVVGRCWTTYLAQIDLGPFPARAAGDPPDPEGRG